MGAEIGEESRIKEMLASAKTIAIVGLSDNPQRDSYKVGKYLQAAGYKIIPVNPMIKSWEGMASYPAISAIPPETASQIDIIDVFRKSEDVPAVVMEAIGKWNSTSGKQGRQMTLWLQLGITNQAAEKMAHEAGLHVISNKCIKIEHEKLCTENRK